MCLAPIFMVFLLSACAGPNADVVPVRPIPQEFTHQRTGGVQGDIIDLHAGTARIETTYVSALGQPCRKLSLIGEEHKVFTECYDGEWRAVNDISGTSPVGR